MLESQALAHKIIEAAKRARSQADVKAEFENLLRQFTEEAGLDLPFRPAPERTIIGAARADAVFGRLVIEYEKPGKLKASNDAPGNRETIEQLTRYITALSEREKRPLAGASTDGRFILFLLPGKGEMVPTDPQPICAQSVQSLLNTIQALGRKILSPDELNRDFGPESQVAQLGVSTLLTRVTGAPRPRVEMMFQEWGRIFGIVYGEHIQKARTLAKLYRIEETIQLKPLLFSVHTYYALFIKLLAAELLRQIKSLPSLTQELLSLDDAALKSKMATLEEGEYFATLGVKYFLEGDLFPWYLDAWGGDLAEVVRRICKSLNQYEPATATFLPEETRDLLKKLYQRLIPKRLRHDLGEDHTPGWLAERLLNQVGYEGNPDRRILDPACGSGTFLVLIINRVHKFLEDHFGRYPDKSVVLNKVLSNVVGFELNPLAVITARTNYLMALGDLLNFMKGEVQIPIYLTDSILAPREQIELFQKGYILHTAAGDFSVPSEIVQAGQIESLTSLLDESVRLSTGADLFLERAKRTCGLDQESFDAARPGLIELYRTMLDLDRQGRNRIWTGIIKNAFAPILVDRFDFVVGTPPWVRRGHLSSEYGAATKKLWHDYGLTSSKGSESRLGGGEKGLSMLFLYACSDNYLRNRGKLGFVITQTVFKAKGAEEGFRRFQLGKKQKLRVIHVDDFAELQPFEWASNRTSALILQKGASTKYPVPYTLWKKKSGLKITPDSTLREAIEASRRFNLCASPIDRTNPRSPWITLKPKAFDALRNVTKKSEYQAQRGAEIDPYGVCQVRLISKQPEGDILVENTFDPGRKRIRKVQAAIEPDFLYPLLRGMDISRWHANPAVFLLMVQDPQKRVGYDERWMAVNCPKTHGYLKNFEDILRGRGSKVARELAEKGAFYSMSGIGEYTFSPFKVVWQRTGRELEVAVISRGSTEQIEGKIIIPAGTVSFVPSEGEEESHYICALLNSAPSRSVVLAFSPSGRGFGAPSILEHLSIPRFDFSNPLHRELAELSLQAHRLVALHRGRSADLSSQGNGEGLFLKEIEEEIDRKAAQLWAITDEELTEIKRSLREMS